MKLDRSHKLLFGLGAVALILLPAKVNRPVYEATRR